MASVLQSVPAQASKPRLQVRSAPPEMALPADRTETEGDAARRAAIVRLLAGRWIAPAHRGQASDGVAYEDGAATLVLTPQGDGLAGTFVTSVLFLDDRQRDELQVEIFVDVSGDAPTATLVTGRVLLNGELAPNQHVDLPAFMFNEPTDQIGVKVQYGDEGGMTRILSRDRVGRSQTDEGR